MCPLLCPHLSFATGEELRTRTSQAFPSPFSDSILPAIFRAFPILSSLGPAPGSQDSGSVCVLDVAAFLQSCFLAHLPGHALLQGVAASQMWDFAIPFLQLGAEPCTTTTLPYQPDNGVPLLLRAPDKLSHNSLRPFQLCSPVRGWGVIPCGNPPSLQPCSDTAQLFKSSPDSLPATTPKGLRSQKRVPGCRRWFGLGAPLTPQHPFCRSKQTR